MREPESARQEESGIHERRLPDPELLSAIFLLDSVKQFGPQKFKSVYEAGVPFEVLVDDPSLLPIGGKRGGSFRAQIEGFTADLRAECSARATKQIERAGALDASIVTYHDPEYPSTVLRSNNPVPALFVRGRLELMKASLSVACVGSRAIREPYTTAQRRFAETAANRGVSVVSGFADGADTVAHLGALGAGGVTVCVMPSGLDRPFPPENKDLWNRFLKVEENAVFVSEFLFGRGAEALTLRKRNKLIVAFSDGVLIGQSSASGGAMNAYRFAREQKKPVATFMTDGASDTSGNGVIADDLSLADAVFSLDAPLEELTQWVSGLSSLT